MQHKLLQIAEDLEAYLRLPDNTPIEQIPPRQMFARLVTVMAGHKAMKEAMTTALTDLRCDDPAAARAILEQCAAEWRVYA
jgi:hypothetical protein